MPDVVTILTKDPKAVPTTAAWLAALAAVTMLIESGVLEHMDIAWLGFPIWTPGTPFYGQEHARKVPSRSKSATP